MDWKTILSLAEIGDNCNTLLEAIINEEDPTVFINAKAQFQYMYLFLQTVLGESLSDQTDPIMKTCDMLKECSTSGVDVCSLSIPQKLQMIMIVPSSVNPLEAWKVMVALLEPQETTQANWVRQLAQKTISIPPDAQVDVEFLIHMLEIHSTA